MLTMESCQLLDIFGGAHSPQVLAIAGVHLFHLAITAVSAVKSAAARPDVLHPGAVRQPGVGRGPWSNAHAKDETRWPVGNRAAAGYPNWQSAGEAGSTLPLPACGTRDCGCPPSLCRLLAIPPT